MSGLVSSARQTSWRAARLARETFDFPRPERAILRWAAFAAARPFTDTLSTTIDGIRYFVSTRDQSIGRVAFMGRIPEGDFLGDYLGLIEAQIGRPTVKGATCVEIGANIGTTTLPLVLQHGAELCVSLEPAPVNLTLLRSNLAANGVGSDRVRVLPVAASDRSGTVEFELASGNLGDNRVRRPGPGAGTPGLYGEKRRPLITVPAVRVDDALAEQSVELSDVGLVWIDTQGHEGQVLAGGTRLLASGAPVVLEYWPYGLRRAEGLELLHRLIESSGRRVIDLREAVSSGKPRALSRAELDALPERYPDRQYTDLALLAE